MKSMKELQNQLHDKIKGRITEYNKHGSNLRLDYCSFSYGEEEKIISEKIISLLGNKESGIEIKSKYVASIDDLFADIKNTYILMLEHNKTAKERKLGILGEKYPNLCCDIASRNMLRQELAGNITNGVSLFENKITHAVYAKLYSLPNLDITVLFDPTYLQKWLGKSTPYGCVIEKGTSLKYFNVENMYSCTADVIKFYQHYYLGIQGLHHNTKDILSDAFKKQRQELRIPISR